MRRPKQHGSCTHSKHTCEGSSTGVACDEWGLGFRWLPKPYRVSQTPNPNTEAYTLTRAPPREWPVMKMRAPEGSALTR